MAERKTVTTQTHIGEGGIALIHTRVIEMGHLFHPRRVDHGIDGHIDLVDPATGALLNSTVLVQSKAQDRRFSSESGNGFHYLCDPRDLDMWLSGNAPVILVLSHPRDGAAWWVDIRAAFADKAARAARKVHVDKATMRFDAGAGPALLALGMPKDRGLYLAPTLKQERLITNLQRLVSYPERLYLAPAITGSYKEAGDTLRSGPLLARGQWILADGLIVSYEDLTEPQWQPVLAGDVEVHDTREWAGSADEVTQNRFADLTRRTIEASYPELRWHKDRRHVHFRATPDLAPRKAGRRKGAPGRTVFKAHGIRVDGSPSYYHHVAAKLRLRRLDTAWFVEITPDWCFTIDGREPSPRSDKLAAGIKRRERHPAVSGWVQMWATFLKSEEDLFSEPRLVGLGELLTFDVDHGIVDSLWGPTPVDDALQVDEVADETLESEIGALLLDLDGEE